MSKDKNVKDTSRDEDVFIFDGEAFVTGIVIAGLTMCIGIDLHLDALELLGYKMVPFVCIISAAVRQGKRALQMASLGEVKE